MGDMKSTRVSEFNVDSDLDNYLVLYKERTESNSQLFNGRPTRIAVSNQTGLGFFCSDSDGK